MSLNSERPSAFKRFLAKLAELLRWLLTSFRSLFSRKSSTSNAPSSVPLEPIAPVPPPSTVPLTPTLGKEETKLQIRLNKSIKKIDVFRRYQGSSLLAVQSMIDWIETTKKHPYGLSIKELKSLEQAISRLEDKIEQTIEHQRSHLKIILFGQIFELLQAADKLSDCDEKQKINKKLSEIDDAITKENNTIAMLSDLDRKVAYTDGKRHDFINGLLAQMQAISTQIKSLEIKQESQRHSEDIQKKRQELENERVAAQEKREKEIRELKEKMSKSSAARVKPQGGVDKKAAQQKIEEMRAKHATQEKDLENKKEKSIRDMQDEHRRKIEQCAPEERTALIESCNQEIAENMAALDKLLKLTKESNKKAILAQQELCDAMDGVASSMEAVRKYNGQ